MNKLGRLPSLPPSVIWRPRACVRICMHGQTLVRRLLFSGKRCSGVEVENAAGAVSQINARLVVIVPGTDVAKYFIALCIGPRAELDKLGVDCVADRPVGKTSAIIPPWVCYVTFKRRP